MGIKLKPCPFCGGKMKVEYKGYPTSRYGIKHVNDFSFSDMCYGGTDYIYESREEAIAEWNKENRGAIWEER